MQPGKFKHLRVDLETVTRPHIPYTSLLLFARAVAGKLPAGRCVHPLTSGKVEEVLPVAGNYALLQLAALLGQVRVLTA